jgi:regulator of replication initiation timing
MDSETVAVACDRLAQALDDLEARVASLQVQPSPPTEILEENQQLQMEKQALRDSLGALGEENKKLKHGLQDAELERIGQRQKATEVLSHLESAISRLEQTLNAA